jgi:FkbM family methyltransferase
MWKDRVVRAARPATRAYVHYAPWRWGKRSAYEFFEKHLRSRPYATTVRTDFGGRIRLALPDLISMIIYLTGQWEPLIARYVRRALRPGDVFVDVGANIGYYTLLASQLVGADGRVFAVEASPSIFRRLEYNIAMNGCGNVCCLNAAAADSPGELPFYLSATHNLGHSTTVRQLADREHMRLEARVPADTLEALIGPENLRGARLIKIDVEGAEHTVLAPLFDSLDEFPRSTEWLLELSSDSSACGQDDIDTIFAAFTYHGYRAYGIRNEYEPDFLLDPPRDTGLRRLSEAPQVGLCDVLMSRNAPLH